MRTRGARHQQREASALVICLVIIVFITILLLGFTVTSRIENQASSSRLAGVEAAQFSRMGVDSAMANLLLGTAPDKRWISQPGRLITGLLNGTNAEIVSLSSGSATNEVLDVTVNLNPSTLVDANGLISSDTGEAFTVRWVYVRKDGSYVTNSPPAFSADNPVQGRYAFWTDDDSTRINWNTAWTRNPVNTNVSSHPSRIDLTAFTNITTQDAQALADFRKTNRLLDSPVAIRAVTNAPGIQEAALDDKFLFTHYNHSPNLNMFNEPRIVLTTRQDRAGPGNTNFIDILKVANSDPGDVSALDYGKVANVFARIYQNLSRTNWPMLPGKNFVNKYQADTAAQIAINIIDYVRSAESTNQVVEPLLATVNASNQLSQGYYGYMGNSRRPLITEVGIVASPNPGSPSSMICKLVMELYLPSGAAKPVDLSQLNWYYPTTLDIPYGWTGYTPADVPITQAHLENGQSLIMNPGEYRVLTVNVPTPLPASGPSMLRIKTRLYTRAPNGYQRAFLDCISYDQEIGLPYTPVLGTSQANILSYAVNDPVVNKHKNEWILGPNTFGSPPNQKSYNPATLPQQDTDSSGTAIDDFSVERSQGEGRGYVKSPAELGYIHTGLKGSAQGTPWRTLRLQPRKSSDETLPDWALIDLFSAPLLVTDPRELAVVKNGSDVSGGKMNINAVITPFEGSFDKLKRQKSLQTLTYNAETSSGLVSRSISSNLAANILNQTTANSAGNVGRNLGPSFYVDNKLYISAGALSELRGFSDLGEKSEAIIRDIAGLADSRGSVFTIFSIGQSIRQAADGTVVVLGEKRGQTTVERRTTANGVELRTVFEKSLGL